MVNYGKSINFGNFFNFTKVEFWQDSAKRKTWSIELGLRLHKTNLSMHVFIIECTVAGQINRYQFNRHFVEISKTRPNSP